MYDVPYTEGVPLELGGVLGLKKLEWWGYEVDKVWYGILGFNVPLDTV